MALEKKPYQLVVYRHTRKSGLKTDIHKALAAEERARNVPPKS